MFVEVRRRQRRHWLWAVPLLGLLLLLAHLAELDPRAWLSAIGSWRAALEPLAGFFLHANWPHLVGNLAFLLVFGLPCERALGGSWTAAMLLAAGICGSVAAQLVLALPASRIIGASGAVSGMVGAYLVLYPNARLGIVLPLGLWLEFVRAPAMLLIAVWATTQLGLSLFYPDLVAVAWPAHLAGFATGLLLALPLREGARRRLRG
jgi:membrane associated rhomboid family serine protease